MELYIAGGYLAIIIYALMLDNDGFREYMHDLCAIILKGSKIENMHPYSVMQSIGLIFLFGSWLSFVGIGLLIYDYLKMKNKTDKK